MHYDEAVPAQPSAQDFFTWEDSQGPWPAGPPTARGIQLGSTSREELERKIFKRNLNYFTNKTPDTEYSDFVMSKEDWATLRSHHGDTPWTDSPEWRAFSQDTAALLDKPLSEQTPQPTDIDFFTCFDEANHPREAAEPVHTESTAATGLGESVPRELLEAQSFWETSKSSKPTQPAARLSSRLEVFLFHGAILATFSLALVNSFGDSFLRLMNIYLTVSRSIVLFKMSQAGSTTKQVNFAQYLHKRGERLLWLDAGSLGVCCIVASLVCLLYWVNMWGTSHCMVSSGIELSAVAGVASSWCLGIMIARAYSIEVKDREAFRISAEYTQVDYFSRNTSIEAPEEQVAWPQEVFITSKEGIKVTKPTLPSDKEQAKETPAPQMSEGIQHPSSSDEEDPDELEFTHLEEEPED